MGGTAAPMSDPIDAAFGEARARWPGVELALEPFRAAVKELGVDPSAIELCDLYLARAAASGDPRAIDAIDAGPLAGAPGWLARYRLSPAELDEIVQRVRVRLFVAGPGRAPRIAEYGGRGPLGAWVRVLLVRETASERRRTRDHAPIDGLARHVGTEAPQCREQRGRQITARPATSKATVGARPA